MIFRGVDFSNHFRILDIRRGILPPLDVKIKKIPGRAGVIIANQEKKSNIIEEDIIEVDIELMENSKSLLRSKIREVAFKLIGTNKDKLILADEPDKYDLAILTGDTNLKEIYTIGTTTLRFLRPEAISYGDIVTEPLDGLLATNNGTYESKGIITVQFNSNSSYLDITLLDTGEFLYLEHDFNINDEVVIDLEKESIRKNGSLIMDDLYLDSDFFAIPVGNYEIDIKPIDVTASLSYIERWL